ncbi:MAG: hypothetical protein Q7U60_07035, partial [Candidatus Methanoperedens sp.]|nr:hypothetical protein [Candidatus Methanoperedens sp.]
MRLYNDSPGSVGSRSTKSELSFWIKAALEDSSNLSLSGVGIGSQSGPVSDFILMNAFVNNSVTTSSVGML